MAASNRSTAHSTTTNVKVVGQRQEAMSLVAVSSARAGGHAARPAQAGTPAAGRASAMRKPATGVITLGPSP
jgi:hypothetical protein